MTPFGRNLITAFLAVAPGSVWSAQSDDSVTVEANEVSGDAKSGRMVLTGNAKLVYGPTVVTATRIVITGDFSRFGFAKPVVPVGDTVVTAEGTVHVDDPDGTMAASELEINLTRAVGHATGVVIRSARVVIHADKLDVNGDRWTLTHVSATTCGKENPLYLLSASRLDVRVGKRAIAHGLGLDVFGRRLLSIPYGRFSLDRRVTDLSLPTITFQEGGKVGLASDNSFLLDEHTSFGADISTFPGEMLRYHLQLVNTRVPAAEASGLVAPKSDLDERFAYGYFDNLMTGTPRDEAGYLRSPRNSVSLGTFWNEHPSARLGTDLVSKPWEVGYELGGPVGPLGGLAQLRAERMSVVHGYAENRLDLLSTLEWTNFAPNKELSVLARLDGAGYLSDSHQSGWGMAQLGLVYSRPGDFRIGAAFVAAGESGSAAFNADRLYSKMGFNARADWIHGPTKLGFLAKYDLSQRRWYDYEYSISQIAGCVEPYVLWRRFPNQFSFGISLRADEFIERLRSRGTREPSGAAAADRGR